VSPAYGPIAVSLTTTRDTSPTSSLAVSRFPPAIGGVLNYSRDNIDFTDVAGTGYSGGTGTAKEIADAVRAGKGVVVIHGIDYDGNGKYSFSQPQGTSELDPSLPAEATDPAGVFGSDPKRPRSTPFSGMPHPSESGSRILRRWSRPRAEPGPVRGSGDSQIIMTRKSRLRRSSSTR
jgi:hypothetical protein